VRVGVALERPGTAPALLEHGGAGEHVAPAVAQHLGRQPVGAGRGADEHEEPVARLLGRGIRRSIAHDDALEHAVAAAADDLGARAHRDALRVQLVDQVLRHAGGERRAAHEQGHGCRVPREMQGSLPRGVAAADHVHDLARHALRLDRGRTVEDARALERLELGDLDPPVRHAGREHHRPARHLVAGGDAHHEAVALGAQPDRLAGVREPRAEHPRLLVRALRELGARNAPREAEVVADERAGAGLAADRLAFDHEHVEPLGCRVHRRREPRRSGSHDDQVRDARPVERGLEPVGLRELGVARVSEHPAVEQHDDGMPGIGRLAECGEPRDGLLASRGQPRVRHAPAREQAPQFVGAHERLVADHGHLARPHADRSFPLEQELGDGAVEVLVRRVPWADHVVLDLAGGHELEHAVARRPVAPGPPLDEQPAPGVGEEPPYGREDGARDPGRRAVVCEDQRDDTAAGSDVGERLHRIVVRRHGHDAVVGRIPAFELSDHRGACAGIGRGDEHHGQRGRVHGRLLIAASARSPRPPPAAFATECTPARDRCGGRIAGLRRMPRGRSGPRRRRRDVRMPRGDRPRGIRRSDRVRPWR
jgi:hypothetical protein